MPIVLIQNRFSASASEILAAALQDNGRATIIGEKSFGKGTVNTARELANGGAVYVSIANWLTPKGALIDNVRYRAGHHSYAARTTTSTSGATLRSPRQSTSCGAAATKTP